MEFISSLSESILANTFIKISLGNYKGSEDGLRNIYVKKVLIKRLENLSFTYRYKTRDIVKNYAVEEGIKLVQEAIENGFRIATLFTNEYDLIMEKLNNQKITLRKTNPSSKNSAVSLNHDHAKKRLIESQGKGYLHELKITDAEGNVYKNAQDKYKQINHYVDILSSLIKEIPAENLKKVVDMGSGKGI
jgi:hypothetical protein